MCDPATLALASTAATVVGGAGSVMSTMSANKAAKKQEAEVLKWQQEQKRNREYAQQRQSELRDEANRSREAGLEQLSGENQMKRQKEEEERLAAYLQGDTQQSTGETGQTPIAQADAALAGQNTSTTSDTFKGDLAAAINTATKGARERMAALAGVSSFGGSFGGLGTTNQEILNRSGSDIDMFNEFRRGELGVHQAKSAVDPVQVTYTPSPLADAFSTAFQLGTQGLGNAMGKGGVINDAWSGLRKTKLPTYAPVPAPRPLQF